MVPDQFSLIEKFDINIFLIKFISYIGFINLFVIFYSFEFQKKYLPKNFLNFLIYLFISFILSRFFMKDVGEINFGFISNYLNPKFFYFILSFSFFLFFNNIYNIIINRTIEKKNILFFSNYYNSFINLINFSSSPEIPFICITNFINYFFYKK